MGYRIRYGTGERRHRLLLRIGLSAGVIVLVTVVWMMPGRICTGEMGLYDSLARLVGGMIRGSG